MTWTSEAGELVNKRGLFPQSKPPYACVYEGCRKQHPFIHNFTSAGRAEPHAVHPDTWPPETPNPVPSCQTDMRAAEGSVWR
jgi:hypothetical protein